MKIIKGKEAVNRTLSKSKGILSCHLSNSLLILILLMTFPNFLYTADRVSATPAKSDNPLSSWKEIQLALDSHDSSWCGNRSIVFSGYGKDKGKGVRLYDLDSGAIQDITDNPSHINVSCAADGRYIVFTDNMFLEKQGSLFIYDRNTKTIKKMYEMESLLLSHINAMPLSPNANYLLGPDLPGMQQYILPGGKEVKLVPYRRGMSYIPEFSEFQWSADESTLYLFDSNSGKLNIRELATNKDTNLYFRINDFWLRNMRVIKDKKMYVDAMSGSDMGDSSETNLYMYDLAPPGKHKLLVNGIEFYDADNKGNIVFSKELKNARGIFYLEREEKKAQILTKITITHNIGIWPKITSDGKGIIFSIPTTPKGLRIYKILIKNGG